jgi:hypothetical protein
MEAVRLRVKDVDVDFSCLKIWNSKGGNIELSPWQYLFPSMKLSIDHQSKLLRRHHCDETTV